MQPAASAMPFVLSEQEPSAKAGAVVEEGEEEEEAAAAAAAHRAGDRTVLVTPLGVLPYSHNGNSAPAFLLTCPAGNGQPALQHVAVGVLGAEEGSSSASSSSSSSSQVLSLTAYLAPVGAAATAAAAAAALLSASSSVMKATVVFALAPPRVVGGAVRPGGATEVSVFPRDPRLACIPGILSGAAGAAPGEAPSAGTAPGTYRLFLPMRAVGARGAGAGADKSGAAAVRTVAAPMPGKVVKVLVEEGAWGARGGCRGAPKAHTSSGHGGDAYAAHTRLHTHTHIHTRMHAYAGSSVTSGQPLFILEAMKMEHVVKAPFAGTVLKLTARPGDIVEDGRGLASVQRK